MFVTKIETPSPTSKKYNQLQVTNITEEISVWNFWFEIFYEKDSSSNILIVSVLWERTWKESNIHMV